MTTQAEKDALIAQREGYIKEYRDNAAKFEAAGDTVAAKDAEENADRIQALLDDLIATDAEPGGDPVLSATSPPMPPTYPDGTSMLNPQSPEASATAGDDPDAPRK